MACLPGWSPAIPGVSRRQNPRPGWTSTSSGRGARRSQGCHAARTPGRAGLRQAQAGEPGDPRGVTPPNGPIGREPGIATLQRGLFVLALCQNQNVRVVLLSTYELGRQPFGLASPAAWLRRAGAEVVVQDLSRQRLDQDAVQAADVIAFYLPMHTATRLALPVLDRVRELNPAARLCAFGLYAPANAGLLRGHGVDATYGAEFEADLVEYACGDREARAPDSSVEAPGTPSIALRRSPACPETGDFLGSPGSPNSLAEPRRGLAAALPAEADSPARRNRESKRPIARLEFLVPDRTGLPGPSRYASLQRDGSHIVVGYTEASRGCQYLCRHCPVVPVYDGQFRVVPTEVVLADIRNQVAAGAAHITFGDPDFFNGPTHARRTITALHDEFPLLTYDVTIKIEHLLRHESMLGILRDTGCLFVTTAVESVDDTVLARLDKGHTAADFERAVGLCRHHGLVLAPTFVPFTPWTSLDGYVGLLAAIRRLDLVEHVAPIQLGIRLLVPNGSRLLNVPEVRVLVGPFDPAALAYPWTHRDARVDALQKEIVATVGRHIGAGREDIFDRVWQRACEFAQVDPAAGRSPGLPDAGYRRTSVPYLNEPWYC